MFKRILDRFKKTDRVLMIITGLLILFGIFIFISASFSMLAQNPGQFYRVVFNHIGLGLFGGFIIVYALQFLDYRVLKKYALYFFIIAILLTLMTKIPFLDFLSFEHGGARRWLSFGFISFQPAELLKITYVIYLAAWLSWVKDKINEYTWGLIPFVIITAIPVVVLFLQPDNGTILVLGLTGIMMYFVAGMRWRDLLILVIMAALGMGMILTVRPYVLSRFQTFFNPEIQDVQGSLWQSHQAKMTVGSGQVFGRGYGKGVQKFRYLPEPAGDSVFAVASEELGFVGALVLVLLFFAFLMRGLYISKRLPYNFARLMVLGLVLLIIIQSFVNIMAMIGLFPLTGMPLIFISQGGTALLFALLSVGIILNLSQYAHKRKT